MGDTAKSLTQYAVETTAGTFVAGKAQFPGESKFDYKPTFDQPREKRGLYDIRFNNTQLVKQEVDVELSGDWYPETCAGLLYAVLTGTPGKVTHAAAGDDPTYYSYTFASDLVALGTLSFEEDDSTAKWKYKQGICTQFELAFTAEGPVTFKFTGFGAAQETLVSLASISAPTDRPLLGMNAKVYINSTYGTLGTTLYGDVTGFKWTHSTGMVPRWLINNAGVYTRTYRGGRDGRIELDIDFASVTEYTNFLASAARYVRVVLTGDTLGGASIKKRTYTLSFPVIWDSWQRDKTSENLTAKIAGNCFYDADLAYAQNVTADLLSNTVAWK